MSAPAAETGVPDADRVLAKLSNEYATVWLELDREANGPRLVVHSIRDHEHVELDPMSLALLCQLDEEVLGLLADMARDPGARKEFHAWMQAERDRRADTQDQRGSRT